MPRPVLERAVRVDPDFLDLESLRDLCGSRAYELIRKRTIAAIETATEQLKQAGTWDETRRLQGLIEGLTLALTIPKILADEIAARRKVGK